MQDKPKQPNKKTVPTDEQLDWLKEAVAQGIKRKVMAKYMGVCEDTVRRILHRTGILEFKGAKYHNRPNIVLWERPCMKCRDNTPRPKNQYICDKCTAINKRDDGLPDDWYFE